MLEVNLVAVAVVLASALWVYLDATKHRIGTVAGHGRLFNTSAELWALGTLLIWIVALPAYLIKRRELKERAKLSPVPARHRGAKAALLAAVGAVWLGRSVQVSLRSADPPSCDAREVVGLAESALRKAPDVRAAGIQIVRISLPSETSFDRAKARRVCRAMLESDRGQEVVHYSVEWHDRALGLIRVQIVPE